MGNSDFMIAGQGHMVIYFLCEIGAVLAQQAYFHMNLM